MDEGLELEALDRSHGLPVLAARAVPNEPPGAVAAIRAAVARAGHRELPQASDDAPDRALPQLGAGGDSSSSMLTRSMSTSLLLDEGLDAGGERAGDREVADDRSIGEILAQRRILRDQAST